jgi:hypothetical protein
MHLIVLCKALCTSFYSSYMARCIWLCCVRPCAPLFTPLTWHNALFVLGPMILQNCCWFRFRVVHVPIVKKIMETIIYLRECACNCAHFSPPIQNPKVINRNLNSFSFNCVLLEPEHLITYRICLAASGGDHRLLVTWDFYSRVGSFYGQLSFTLVWKIHQVRLCKTCSKPWLTFWHASLIPWTSSHFVISSLKRLIRTELAQ